MGYKVKPKYPLFLRDVNKNNICNGYPIVTIKDNFNIEAKPDTFHDIKNNADDEININFVDKEFYPNDITNEFIFNVRSPANISFNKEIKWNNNEEPDFTQICVYTISILNGIGCYTFVNIDSISNDEIWYTSSDGNIVTPNNINALPEIDTNTYSNGKGVIKFKTDITKIGNEAFKYCRSLTSITIPNSVTSIGNEAFYYCTSLTSIAIPNSVTSIGDRAFYYCTSLTSIAIPNSVTSIGDRAFYDCFSLISVIIGNGMTSIGYAAFYDCESLTSISYNGTISQWNAITKDNWNLKTPVTVVHCTDGDIKL